MSHDEENEAVQNHDKVKYRVTIILIRNYHKRHAILHFATLTPLYRRTYIRDTLYLGVIASPTISNDIEIYTPLF